MKAMQIVALVTSSSEPPSARELAKALDMPVATTYHLAETLVDGRLLMKDPRGRYDLGPLAGAVADTFAHRNAPPPFLLAPLRELADTTGETAYVTAWHHDDAVVLAYVEGSHAVRVGSLHTGYRGYSYARASGKALLAFRPQALDRLFSSGRTLQARTSNTITDRELLRRELDVVRVRGYALDEEEFTPGVSCVAAPIMHSETAIAAFTLAVPTDRFQARRRTLVNAVVSAAQAASTDVPAPLGSAA